MKHTKHIPMTRTEIELAGITGIWKDQHLSEVNPLTIKERAEIKDFLLVLNLYNAEVLEDMDDRTVARRMLADIGIYCDDRRDPWG